MCVCQILQGKPVRFLYHWTNSMDWAPTKPGIQTRKLHLTSQALGSTACEQPNWRRYISGTKNLLHISEKLHILHSSDFPISMELVSFFGLFQQFGSTHPKWCLRSQLSWRNSASQNKKRNKKKQGGFFFKPKKSWDKSPHFSQASKRPPDLSSSSGDTRRTST